MHPVFRFCSRSNHRPAVGSQSEEDQWKLPVKAERSVTIPAHTRLCQFRILTNQPVIMFDTVDHLKDDSRGGFGSTGN